MDKVGKIKVELEVGTYEEMEVDDLDFEAIKKIEERNKQVRKKKYYEKKIFSRYSIEQIERKCGQIASPELSPLDLMIQEENESMRKIIVQMALDLLPQAMKTLTDKQYEAIYKTTALEKTVMEVALEKGCSVQTVYYLCNRAKSKLKKFYMKFPKFNDYFPDFLTGCDGWR